MAPTYRYAEVVASLPPGSEIVFDYAIAPATLGEEDRARHDDAAGVVATRGEPWLTYFEPATLGPELRAIGLKQVEDLGPMSSTSGTSRTRRMAFACWRWRAWRKLGDEPTWWSRVNLRPERDVERSLFWTLM